jgi:hypothetical protein
VTAEGVPALRQRPGPGVGEHLPANFLKHADDQTVVALSAVLQAIQHFRMADTCFTHWGIVSAPCFLGRSALVAAQQRFAVEGAWGMSPHFIPHRTQHAISGTISQALKVHGPNFGAGGGPSSPIEALLAAAVLAQGKDVPGVWVVMSGWNPEQIPDPTGRTDPQAVCTAVALALTDARAGRYGPRLKILPAASSERMPPSAPPSALARLEAFLAALDQGETMPAAAVWPLDGGGRLELGLGGSIQPPHRFRPRPQGPGRWRVESDGAGTENKR